MQQRLGSVMMLHDCGADPEVGGRGTSAAFVLDSIEEVKRFLDQLAR